MNRISTNLCVSKRLKYEIKLYRLLEKNLECKIHEIFFTKKLKNYCRRNILINSEKNNEFLSIFIIRFKLMKCFISIICNKILRNFENGFIKLHRLLKFEQIMLRYF